MESTGKLALVFIVITLTITPLRRFLSWLSSYLHARYGKRLSDWNWIIRLRRMIGLFSFFYACAHLFVYLVFDLGFEWAWAIQDIEEKPYIVVGMITFLLLIPMVLTSTNGMMKRLGKNWRRLHRLVYVCAITSLVHYWWMLKVGDYSAWPYTAIIIVLLGYRLFAHYGLLMMRPRDDGMEVSERKSRNGVLGIGGVNALFAQVHKQL